MRDLDRAVEFWHVRLGLPIKLRSAGMVELQSETILLVLQQGEPAPGVATLAWEVADLEAARAELASHGIPCTACPPPTGTDPAAFGRRLAFADPDGHRLELACWTPP